MQRPGRNDPCHCGEPKKYKHCCLSLDENRGARGDLLRSAQTLRDRNIAVLAAASDIFGLNRPWDKVKEGFTDARISEFYGFVAGVWPVGTDQRHILPAPDSSLRALYLGENEPEMMVQNVFRFSLYADQTLLDEPNRRHFFDVEFCRSQTIPQCEALGRGGSVHLFHFQPDGHGRLGGFCVACRA
jgi:hypothetical protein